MPTPMKFIRTLLAFLIVGFFLIGDGFGKGKNSDGSVKVDGYTKKDGTVVVPHNRTAPNKTKNDNWSTKGNVNPYTGKAGTKPRDGETSLTRRPSSTSPTYSQPEVPTKNRAVLQEKVRRCNALLDSYNNAGFGQRPFNASRYEEIRRERDAALGELNNGR